MNGYKQIKIPKYNIIFAGEEAVSSKLGILMVQGVNFCI